MQNYLKIAFYVSQEISSKIQQELWANKVLLFPFQSLKNLLSIGTEIDAIIVHADISIPENLTLIKQIRNQLQFQNLPLVVLGTIINNNIKRVAISNKIDDLLHIDIDSEQLLMRLNFLIDSKKRIKSHGIIKLTNHPHYNIKWNKRAFDIIFSSAAIILFLPIFLTIALIITLTSRGPIFYSSKRVGAGFKIFNFYKFRSMIVDADSKIKDVKHLNHYNNDLKKEVLVVSNTLCSECIERETTCQSILFKDGDTVCERLHKIIQKDLSGATFIKVKGDPRVTAIGRFIRKTSIDELPQLFNVVLGDMSIVGNRPLPLYEAERITTDKFITRFLAPAGITGLWQISKQGKDSMSQEERMAIDNTYAQNHSLWLDIKIIAKTLPAMLQKDNV
jgi:lipopolysaccharide/colanic/teichoic acid biosynthesis glycosyltransferase